MITPARSYNGPKSKRVKVSRRTRSVRSSSTRVPARVSFGKQLLPRTLNNTLTYVTAYNIGTNASGFGSASFRANGMYDPEVSIGGHQPLGFDQLSALYDHWYVKSSRIEIQLNYGALNVPVSVALYVDDDTTLATTFSSAAERPGAVTQAFFIGDGTTYKKMYNSFDSKKFFGLMSAGNSQLKGTAAADPTEQAEYAIIVDGGVLLPSSSVSFIVKIEYDVEWSEIATFAQS